jgi:hypothetical protein
MAKAKVTMSKAVSVLHNKKKKRNEKARQKYQ